MRKRKYEIDWEKVDWGKRNVDLAKELDCPPPIVSCARKKFAHETIQHKPFSGVDWSKIDWSKRTKEIVEETGVEQSSVSHARSRYAPETSRNNASYCWEQVDWDNKSNKEIRSEVDCSISAIARNRAIYAPHTTGKFTNARKAVIHRIANMEWESIDEEGCDWPL